MRSFCGFVFVLTCTPLLIPAASAQSGKGAIAGRVADSSGGALIGAQVTVQPKGATGVSDARANSSSMTLSLEATRSLMLVSRPLRKQ